MTFRFCVMFKINQSFKKSKLPVKTVLMTLKYYCCIFMPSKRLSFVTLKMNCKLPFTFCARKSILYNFQSILSSGYFIEID